MQFGLILSSLFFALLLPVFQLPAAAAGEVLKQEIAVSLAPSRHEVAGESTVVFAPGSRSVRLRLASRAQVESVRCAGRAVPFTFRSGAIALELPQGETSATVSYRASFNDQASRHPAAAEDPSYGVNAAVGSEGTFLGGGAYWYPVPDQVPASRRLTVSAPAGIEAVSFGARLSRETSGGVSRSVWQEARPVGVLSLCAGPYLVEERQAAGVTLYSYFYRDNAELAPRYLEATAKYLALYQELFGPYPFEKYAIVENFFPTGYGFPSFTLLGGSVIRLPFIVDTSLPHEIAHSWWGNGIDVDLAEGNWCEGLVTYLADYLLKERRSKAEGADYRRQLLIDYASLVTPENDFPLTAFVSRNDPASRAIGYGKGAMVFHMIRSRVGDRAFFDALKDVVRQRMYGSASWSDLLRAFSERSRMDLSGFRQWLDRPGGPHLTLRGVESRRQGDRWQVTGRVRQSAPFFTAEVPLRLEGASGTLVKEVLLPSTGAADFAVQSPGDPKRLLLDPDAEIFRVLSPAEIPATVNSIKGGSGVIGVLTRACRTDRGTFHDFLASLSQGKAAIVEEENLKPGEAAIGDLVFCGVPSATGLIPSAGTRGAGDEVSADSLLFQVLKRAAPGRGFVALFQPGSQAAALQYGPKVTHYGKYGYLFFAGGANRRKGTAAAAPEGVAVQFSTQAP